MKPLRIRAVTIPCIFLFIIAAAAGLFALCMGVTFQEIRFLFLALPTPATGLWWFLRAGYSLTFFPDRLEIRRRFSAEVIPYARLAAEFRPFSARVRPGAPCAHLPWLCLRRDGAIAASFPRGSFSLADMERAIQYLRAAGVPLKSQY